MELNGKQIQENLLANLSQQIADLKEENKTPCIAIVTLGPEDSWEAYVKQKILLAKKLGINYKLINLSPKSTKDVLEVVAKLNSENTIQGLIVQRPFPTYIDTERIIQSVSKEKDIDGFRSDSLYVVPVFSAVLRLLTQVPRLPNGSDFKFWLSNQHILIIGKGETAGSPVKKGFEQMGISTSVMDSKSDDRINLFEKADIIIFATGKSIEVPFDKLKKSTILIGIGLHRENGQLTGDFDENEAKSHGLYYSPSPGGVGPLNLYYLFENLVAATKNRR